MKAMFLAPFSAAALWDGFTTMYGTVSILDDGTNNLSTTIAGFLTALLVLVILVFTARIVDLGVDAWGIVLKGFWFLCESYDLLTSYMGNKAFIFSRHMTFLQAIILLMMTIIISGSPLLLSFFIKDSLPTPSFGKLLQRDS